MIRKIELAQFLRSFKITPDGQMAFFLGSGASIQAGIPTGSNLVWEFKKEIYCSKTGTSPERFKDLQSKTNRTILQDYFDAEGDNPRLYDPYEYSHYFEKCYPASNDREQFIRDTVRDIKPSLGYSCLGDLIIKGKIKNVWTTNFDELIEAGIKQLEAGFSVRVLSSANKDSINIADDNGFPNIYKLHGDYRYDKIKNTLQEVQKLENTMNQKFEDSLCHGGLIVAGYSGNDESIMGILERNVSKPAFLSRGMIWLKHKYSDLSERTRILMDQVCDYNENSGIIEIDGFDEFVYSCYQISSGDNQIINERWKDFSNRRLPIAFSYQKANYFIKLNTFESISIPKPVSFDSDITSWKELREIAGSAPLITALFARKVYCFGTLELINKTFQKHILSNPISEDVPPRYLYRNDSFYTSMLYDLINVSLVEKENIKRLGRNKYYNTLKHDMVKENNVPYTVYDAIEVYLEFIHSKYHLSLLLTVYVVDKDGNPVNKEIRKTITNKKLSTTWNMSYNEKLKEWNGLLRKDNTNTIEFFNAGFCFLFNHACITYGQIIKAGIYPQRVAYQFDEPIMLFNINNKNAKGINQLRGISNYGPIDFSYTTKPEQRYSIKLAVIAPNNDLQKLLNHLSNLKKGNQLSKDDGFTPVYNGFEKIYKQDIDIPQLNDRQRCIIYNEGAILSKEILVNVLKEKIDHLSTESQNFSILIIYIPQSFEQFRIGNSDEDFNLHDAVKLYGMNKGIKVQFIEEKSLRAYEPCKVMWALSASLYAKKGGVLWQPESMNNSTAFVGISYALSKEKGISVGCSQLFDASGTGLRLLLRKINDPQFIHKNPFMKVNEARQMVGLLREQYYKSSPASRLDRIVIHKTTFFTPDEIQGFTQALEGIEDIELLQIQEFTPWRGIRYKNIDNGNVDGFSMKRGTVLQLSDNQYLLWTHGCVLNDELKGKNMNYYKGGRGIPQPLMIKRFYGKATGDILTKEILMLTKMNWNSGDSLYKTLPVTLDFAKILARMSKQNEVLYDQLYDFRYFM